MAASAPAASCCPRPRGAAMVLQLWRSATDTVSSDEPPSTTIISPLICTIGFKHSCNVSASFSVGIMIDNCGRRTGGVLIARSFVLVVMAMRCGVAWLAQVRQ